MRSRLLRTCCLFVILCALILPATAGAAAPRVTVTTPARDTTDFPAVDPNYIYNQLYQMATHYLHRESGYDTGLPPNVNGHDEFAAYWTQEMLRNLEGFHPQARRDDFPAPGWTARPPSVPAFNMEVSVPGVSHPEQIVVIGCHYD